MSSFNRFDSFQNAHAHLNESHYILLFCPSALTFLKPLRGIGWDCTAMECSPLAQGSKCLGARGGGESKNKITGFVTPQIYSEANSLYLCAHKVARRRRPGLRKATEAAIRRKSPRGFSTKEWRTTTPCYVILWSHMTLKWIAKTFKTTCPFLFALPLDKEQASAPVEGNPRTFKSRSSIDQPTLLLLHRRRNGAVMPQYKRLSEYSMLIFFFPSSKTNIQLYEHLQIKERNKHSASCEIFFFSKHQSKRWFESTSLSITVWQSKHTSLVSTTPPLFTHTLYVIQWHRNKSTVYCNNKTLLYLFNRYLSWYIYY